METTPRLTHQVVLLALAIAVALAIILAAGPARAEGAAAPGSCDELVARLGQPATPLPMGVELDYPRRVRVLEGRLRRSAPPVLACRAELRSLCTTQDLAAREDFPPWLAGAEHAEARAVCAGALATQPGSGPVRAAILETAVRRQHTRGADDWEIDEALVAAANTMGTPALREQLVPVLEAAWERRAAGYDQLRAAICAEDGPVSADRTAACSKLPAGAQSDWQRQRDRGDVWAARIGLTLGYAALVTTAYVGRDRAVARKVATAGGACGGGMVGGVTGWALVHGKRDADVDSSIKVGILAGAALGGVTAYVIARSDGARGPLAAVGFVPLPLAAITLD